MPVILQERDFTLIRLIAKYSYLTRSQIETVLTPAVPSRNLRRILKRLYDAGFINRHLVRNSVEGLGPPTPLYYSAQQGLQHLAEHDFDDTYLHVAITKFPQSIPLHCVAVTNTHIMLRGAAQQQDDISLTAFSTEHSCVNPSGVLNGDRRRTTHIPFPDAGGKKHVTAKPDAVFGLGFAGLNCVYFLEEDRHSTNSSAKVIATKMPGYRRIFCEHTHVSHYSELIPDALNDFRILFVTPSAERRDALARACDRQLTKMEDQQFRGFWKFVSKSDLNVDSFFSNSIVRTTNTDQPLSPLVATPTVSPGDDEELAVNVIPPIRSEGQHSFVPDREI